MGTFRFIVIALLSIFLVGCSTSPPNINLHDSTQNSLDNFGILAVTGESGMFFGSAFSIHKDLIATASHLYTPGCKLYFNDKLGELYKNDPNMDIAIFIIPNHGFKVFELADAQLMEKSYVIGYIGYYTQKWPVVGQGYITSLNFNGMLLSSNSVQPGLSGCPILRSDYRVLGITSACLRWSEDGIQSFVPNSTMSTFAPSTNIRLLLLNTPYENGV